MQKSSFKKKYVIAVASVIIALLVSSCNLSPAIATIANSGRTTTISQSEFSTFINDYKTLLNREVVILSDKSLKTKVTATNVVNLDSQNGMGCILPNSSINLSDAAIAGSGKGTFSSNFISCALTQMIDASFLTEKLSQLNVSLTKSQISAAETAIEAQFNSALGVSGVFSGLSSYFKQEIAEYEASQQQIFSAVQAGLSYFSPQQLLSKFSLELSNFCVNAFNVQSATEATDVVALINQGKSMSSLAKQLGQPTSSGSPLQSLGCGSMVNESQLAYQVFQLPRIYKGEAFVIPTQNSYGSPLYLVASITSITPEKYSSNLDSNLKSISSYIVQKQAQTSLFEIEHYSTISVDPKYGSWVSLGGASFGVCPVNAAAIPFALNQTALSPANDGSFVAPTNC